MAQILLQLVVAAGLDILKSDISVFERKMEEKNA